MMAAVAIGAYPDMHACIAEWVTPLLGPPEPPDPALIHVYDELFLAYTGCAARVCPRMGRPRIQRAARRHDADRNNPRGAGDDRPRPD